MASDMHLSGLVEFHFGRFRLARDGVTFLHNAPFGVQARLVKDYWSAEEVQAFHDYMTPAAEEIGLGRLYAQALGLGLWHGGAVFWPVVYRLNTQTGAGMRRMTLEVHLMPRATESRVVLFCQVPKHLPFAEVASWEMAVHDDPEAAVPYHDWCQEREWGERAFILRATPRTSASAARADPNRPGPASRPR